LKREKTWRFLEWPQTARPDIVADSVYAEQRFAEAMAADRRGAIASFPAAYASRDAVGVKGALTKVAQACNSRRRLIQVLLPTHARARETWQRHASNSCVQCPSLRGRPEGYRV
jgi:hypothetical protein